MFAPARRLHTLIVTVLLTVVAGLIAAPSALASHDVRPARVSGQTRAATAANVAELAYPEGTDVAFLARDDGFVDALAAAALAGSRTPRCCSPTARSSPTPSRTTCATASNRWASTRSASRV